VDTLSLRLDVTTVTLLASYGITDRLDVGATMPVSSLRFSGRRVNTFRNQIVLQSERAGTETGLSDVAVNARYTLMRGSETGLAVGTDVRFPTGNEEDLLGAGEAAWRVLGIASWERGRWAIHRNAGFGLGGASRELFWTGAATLAASQRLSFAGEFIGRWLAELNRVQDVYQPHPVLAGIETMRWLPAEGGVNTAFLATGFKWNVAGDLLLNCHLLTRLTDAGLSARVSPSVGLEYAITR
jgi:hypothetical protein